MYKRLLVFYPSSHWEASLCQGILFSVAYGFYVSGVSFVLSVSRYFKFRYQCFDERMVIIWNLIILQVGIMNVHVILRH